MGLNRQSRVLIKHGIWKMALRQFSNPSEDVRETLGLILGNIAFDDPDIIDEFLKEVHLIEKLLIKLRRDTTSVKKNIMYAFRRVIIKGKTELAMKFIFEKDIVGYLENSLLLE